MPLPCLNNIFLWINSNQYYLLILCLLHVLLGLGFPVIIITWVGLQEMDSLKRWRSLSGSVAHLATPAISYIYNCLRSQEPRLRGQSMQQDAESISEWKLKQIS